MKTVVLLSGGLDSFIAYCLAPEPKLALWVDLGQPYAAKEEEAIDSLAIPEVKKLRLANILPEKPTIDEWIIPGRNLLLVTLAAMYGDEIWLSALDGERHKFAREKDKTPEFYHLASGLLTYVFDITRNETRVVTPFENMTKTQAVEQYLDRGFPEKLLLKTSSCYHESVRNCGDCGTCFKRWIAMKNNAIEESYETPPWENQYAKKTIEEMKMAYQKKDFKHYSYLRCLETFAALRLQGVKVHDDDNLQ